MIVRKNNKNGRNGFFISFEGPEGSGKTTQINLLKQYFESRRKTCIVTREPGGTELGETIRKIVKYHNGSEKIHDETELLLFAASRAQHVKNLILPALEEDRIVICDRFIDSTTAYQGFARKLDLNFVNALNNFAACGCIPDLTFLLDISIETGFARAAARNPNLFKQDRIESESREFHKTVRDAFLKIAAENKQRVRVINADNKLELIHAEIMEQVNHVMGLF